MEGQGYRTGAPNSPESPILVTGGVVCRQSAGLGGSPRTDQTATSYPESRESRDSCLCVREKRPSSWVKKIPKS